MDENRDMTKAEKHVAEYVMGKIRERIPDAILRSCSIGYDCDDFFDVHIGVKPGTIDKAYEAFRGIGGHFKVPAGHVCGGVHDFYTANFMFEPIMPRLVHAKLGDWVLIYKKWHDEPEWAVGMVTSIRTEGGKKAYGVRYVHEAVKVDLGSVEVFEVSGEEYGGLQPGFAAILTEKEALERIEKQVKEKVDKYTKKLKDCMSGLRSEVRRKTKFGHHVEIKRIQAEPMRIVDPEG